MTSEKITCQNCEQIIDSDCNFCPHCGQKTNEELTLGVLFYNTISNYFSFDARFLKSFVPLMFKPGYLAKKFLEGKRLLYLHPAQMYLFISVLFFFVFSFTVNDWIDEANTANEKIVESANVVSLDDESKRAIDSIVKSSVNQPLNDQVNYDKNTQKVVDSLVKNLGKKNYPSSIDFGISKHKLDSLRQAGATQDEIYKEMGMDDDAGFMTRGVYKTLTSIADGKGLGGLIKRFVDTIPIAMFFLLPIFALILKVFYFSRGRYAHHLVFSFYFFSFLFTVFLILIVANRFIPNLPAGVSWLIALSTFIYFYLALLHFYKRNWFFTFIKANIITFIFLIMVIPFAAGIISVVALINA